jgi:hypothetical protein
MSVKNMAQLIHVVPVHFAANSATGVATAFVNMKLFEKVEFIISFGTMGTADYAFKMQASATYAGGTATDLAFNYRKTATAGTDTMGDVTAVVAASSCTAAYLTDSAMLFIVDMDSAELTADKPYVGVYLTRGSSATAQIQIIALCWPKYPQETNSGALT